MREEQWQLFCDEATAMLVPGTAFDLMVIDTLAKAMMGGDENSAKDAGMFDLMVQGTSKNRPFVGG